MKPNVHLPNPVEMQSHGDESYRLSEILNSKGIKHWLDDGKWRGHEWSYWRDMLPYYLSKI
jgi:esterase/lipase superfamily enzyme